MSTTCSSTRSSVSSYGPESARQSPSTVEQPRLWRPLRAAFDLRHNQERHDSQASPTQSELTDISSICPPSETVDQRPSTASSSRRSSGQRTRNSVTFALDLWPDLPPEGPPPAPTLPAARPAGPFHAADAARPRLDANALAQHRNVRSRSLEATDPAPLPHTGSDRSLLLAPTVTAADRRLALVAQPRRRLSLPSTTVSLAAAPTTCSWQRSVPEKSPAEWSRLTATQAPSNVFSTTQSVSYARSPTTTTPVTRVRRVEEDWSHFLKSEGGAPPPFAPRTQNTGTTATSPLQPPPSTRWPALSPQWTLLSSGSLCAGGHRDAGPAALSPAVILSAGTPPSNSAGRAQQGHSFAQPFHTSTPVSGGFSSISSSHAEPLDHSGRSAPRSPPWPAASPRVDWGDRLGPGTPSALLQSPRTPSRAGTGGRHM